MQLWVLCLCRKIGTRATKIVKNREEEDEGEETLAHKSHDFEKPVRLETGFLIGVV